MEPLWGIDLGGTKIEGVVLASKNPSDTLARLRIPTEKDKGYDHVINQVEKLVRLLEEESGVKPTTIGIGTPGTTDPQTQLLKNSNTTALNGRPFIKDLQAQLKIPVRSANDANCFAVAETNMGVVKEVLPDAQVVFGVIMGTGVGGGVVVNGKGLNGRHGIGGEWGHNFLDESGGQCYCGKVGCVETVISGPALERFYFQQTQEKLTLKEIVQLSNENSNPAVEATLDRLVHFFGKGISEVINVLDPDAIVLGGGLGNIPILYDRGVEEVKKYIFNHRLDTLFLKPQLGDSAGVFGAALLCHDD